MHKQNVITEHVVDTNYVILSYKELGKEDNKGWKGSITN